MYIGKQNRENQYVTIDLYDLFFLLLKIIV